MAKRLLARLGIWRTDDLATVPPELSACEYDCVKKECDEEHFEVCERRLRTADILRAEADRQAAAAATQSEPCIAPPVAANNAAANNAAAASTADLSAGR